MNKEKQRIAIAKACGFKCSEDSHELGQLVAQFTPDYLNDLNAMAEAENLVLKSAQQCRDYANVLDDGNGGHFATSAQRAEAFLKTIGKWEDEA
jgi:hypothetical protein